MTGINGVEIYINGCCCSFQIKLKKPKISTFSTRLKYYAAVAESEHTTAYSPFVVTVHLVGFTSRDKVESQKMQIYIKHQGWMGIFILLTDCLFSSPVLFPDL